MGMARDSPGELGLGGLLSRFVLIKQISRIEGGKSAPSFETLEAIAIHLQVAVKDLLYFQHLVIEESIEDQALRLLGTMDNKKQLSLRILNDLYTRPRLLTRNH